MKKVLFTVFLFLSIIFIVNADFEIQANLLCTTCDTCNSQIVAADPGDYVLLTANVETTVKTCINISRGDILFSCYGGTEIKGNGSYAILINRSVHNVSRLTIDSCRINGWEKGIFARNVVNITMSNLSISNTSIEGIHLVSTKNITIVRSNFTHNINNIRGINVTNVLLGNNTFLHSQGLIINRGKTPTITYSVFKNISTLALRIDNSTNVTINWNNFTNVNNSINIKNSSNVSVTDNVFNKSKSLIFNLTNNFNFSRNTFLGNSTSELLHFERTHYGGIIKNTFYNPLGNRLVHLLHSKTEAFSNNTLINGTNAVYLENMTTLNFTYNNLTNFIGVGVSIQQSPVGRFSYNRFYNVTIGLKMLDTDSDTKTIFKNIFNISTTAIILNNSINLEVLNNTIDNATYGIKMFNAETHIIENNTIINVQNPYYKEFNLSSVNSDTNTNVTSLLKLYSEFGIINFLNTVDYSSLFDFSSILGSNNISANTSANPGLNSSAEINLYDVDYVNVGLEFEQDGEWNYCDNSRCNVLNYSDNNLLFNVTQFSGLRARGDNIGLSSDADAGDRREDEEIFFENNFTNVSRSTYTSGVTCTIQFNLSDGWTNATNMSLDGAFKSSYAFTDPGTYVWLVVCNNSGSLINFSSSISVLARVTVGITTSSGASRVFSFIPTDASDIEASIEEGKNIFINSPDYVSLTNEHSQRIAESMKDTIPEDWVNVEVKKIDDSSETTIATIATLDASEKFIVDKKAKDTMGSLRENTRRAQIATIPTTNHLTTYTVINKDTGETVNRSAISVAFSAEYNMSNTSIIQIIPKNIALSASELKFIGKQPTILQDDPIVEWTVDNMRKGDSKEFTYIVKRKVTKLETIVIGSGKYEDRVTGENLPCSNISKGNLSRPVTSLKAEVKDEEITPGYEVAIPAFNLKCDGEDIDFTVSVPLEYTDVKILKCTDEGCLPKEKKTVTELKCGNKIIRETVIEEEFGGFVPINISNVTINYDEFKQAFESMKLMDFYDNKDEFILETSAIQPQNPNLKILGAPIKIRLENLEETSITLPVITAMGFEDNSQNIYVKTNDLEWQYIGGEIKDNFITATIPKEYFINNEIEVAVMGILCLNCIEAEMEMAYSPDKSSKDVVVLVHGLASSPATYEDILKDIRLTEQPFNVLTFAYPTSHPIKKSAEKFASLLEEHVKNFDNVYIVAHSMGGLVTQQGLNLTRDKKYVQKIKKVVLVGTPNEGVPEVDSLGLMFQFLVNLKTENKMFNLRSGVVEELAKGMITPRLDHIDYYVIAGEKPFRFSKALNINETNDGIVTVPSAQRVGDGYLTNQCKDFWGLKLSHNELIDNVVSRKLIERIVAEEILKGNDDNSLLGNTQFFEFNVNDCSPDDKYVVIGVKLNQSEIYDPTGCSCGNGVCGQGEDETSCPSDCAVFEIRTKSNLSILGLILVFISLIYFLSHRKKLKRKRSK